MSLMRMNLVLRAEGVDAESLTKQPVRVVVGGVEREVIYTTQGFVETACLERSDKETPGAPPVIKTVETTYRLHGEIVRQDVNVQVDRTLIGADAGALG